MGDYILIGILVLIIGGALAYIIRAKKSGVKCIGCPSANKCSGNCSACQSHAQSKVNTDKTKKEINYDDMPEFFDTKK